MEYQIKPVEDGVKAPDVRDSGQQTETLINVNDDKREEERTEEEDDEEKEKDENEEREVPEDEQKMGETEVQDIDFVQEPEKLEELMTEVRRTNFEGFKNFYSDKDIRPIIQTLYGGVSLLDDVHNERKRRGPNNEAQETSNQQKEGQAKAEKNYLHRVRIHSPCILRILSQVSNYNGMTPWRPTTFCRPFKTLIHFQPQMKEQLERLEKKWGRVDSSIPVPEEEKDDEKPDDNARVYIDSKYAFLHMQVYVEFIDQKVMPLFNQFSASSNNYTKVTFADLWYLFREGDLFYSPVPKQRKGVTDGGYTTSNLTLQGSYQNVWRIYSIVSPQVADELDDGQDDAKQDVDNDRVAGSDDDSYGDRRTFRIWGYSVDYDGESYGPVQRHFHINKFEGERDIRSLAVYPVRLVNDYENFLKTQQQNGALFKKYVERKHLYHSGWTLTSSTTGAPLDGIEKYPEHIDGQVIADFSEAYQTITSWKPEIHNLDISSAGEFGFKSCGEMKFGVLRYTPNKKSTKHVCISLHQYDDIGVKRRNAFIENDKFLSAVRKGDDKEVIQNLEGDSLAILPKRLVVFSLMQRKFVHVNISCLKMIEQDERFDSLSINTHHKKMIRSLVHEHFRKKKQQHVGQEVQYQDLIKGKGTGLIFLLHGVPGVGKTATAEAVALDNRKPLFAITCGDLGFEPVALENNLSRIFRLANLWDCILLLDEADVFFTKRAPSDLQRNALVTVFLRILEYYSGVLFLTTNRVGIIDEAFKSRVHMSLYYPELDRYQYRMIFDLNIQRIQGIEKQNEKMGEPSINVDANSILDWCEHHFAITEKEIGRWNGRQIKNAFQIGASLVHYDLAQDLAKLSGTNAQKQRKLDANYFELVAETTREFDKYMATTRKGVDSELAKREGLRNNMGATSSYSGEYSYGSGGYRQGQPFSQPTESPRYVPSQPGYRDQGRGHYEHDSRRAPDSYGQYPSSQGPHMNPNNSYNSPRPMDQGPREYGIDNQRERPEYMEIHRFGDEDHSYIKSARSQQPQNQYSGLPPNDR